MKLRAAARKVLRNHYGTPPQFVESTTTVSFESLREIRRRTQ